MRKFFLSLAVGLMALVLAALALGYPPATVTVNGPTSVTIGSLDCNTLYEFRVREWRSGAWRDSQTYTRTTAACPDTTPPNTTITSGPSGTTQATDATFQFTSSETNSTFECALTGPGDPGTFGVCASPKSYTGLQVGTHHFEVRAKDVAGNTDPTPAQRSWTVEAAPPPPSGEPGPIAGEGYTVRFEDQFDTLNRMVWDDHIWYEGAPPVNSQFVQDGALNLVSRRSQGYPNINVTTQTSGRTFERGYFEARMRTSGGNGAWPAFWLFSYRHATNPSWPSVNPLCAQIGEPTTDCYSAELDVFEGQGREPQSYYGTVHRNSCNCYGVSNTQNSNNWSPAGVNLPGEYHVYAAKWTATNITWYIDGRALHTSPVFDSTDQPMYVLLSQWIGGWTGGTDASTADEVKNEIDWVRIWQQ